MDGESAGGTMRATVGLIDDDPMIIALLRRALERRRGLDVIVEESDGFRGLAAVSAAKPDALIIDVQIPGLDGVEVARRIRAERPDAVIVLFTATSVPRDTAEAADAVHRKADGVEPMLDVLEWLLAARPSTGR